MKMDAFLTAAALRSLEAAGLLAGRSGAAGFLAGHRRGGRAYVEAAIPADPDSWVSPEAFAALDDLYEGRIIGFYVFSLAAADRRRIGRPHACGKILITAKKLRSGGLNMRSFFIDYQDRFVLTPIPLARDRGRTP
jgi:hypothetical protein